MKHQRGIKWQFSEFAIEIYKRYQRHKMYKSLAFRERGKKNKALLLSVQTENAASSITNASFVSVVQWCGPMLHRAQLLYTHINLFD